MLVQTLKEEEIRRLWMFIRCEWKTNLLFSRFQGLSGIFFDSHFSRFQGLSRIFLDSDEHCLTFNQLSHCVMVWLWQLIRIRFNPQDIRTSNWLLFEEVHPVMGQLMVYLMIWSFQRNKGDKLNVSPHPCLQGPSEIPATAASSGFRLQDAAQVFSCV